MSQAEQPFTLACPLNCRCRHCVGPPPVQVHVQVDWRRYPLGSGTVTLTGRGDPPPSQVRPLTTRTETVRGREVTWGECEFEGVAPGDYSLRAVLKSRDGNDEGVGTVRAWIGAGMSSDGQSTTQNVLLDVHGKAGQVLIHIVRENGAPASGVTAVIRLPDGATGRERTDGEGKVRLPAVSGEQFQLVGVDDPVAQSTLVQVRKESER